MDGLFSVITSPSQNKNEAPHSPPFNAKESKLLHPFIEGDMCWLPGFVCCCLLDPLQFTLISLSRARRAGCHTAAASPCSQTCCLLCPPSLHSFVLSLRHPEMCRPFSTIHAMRYFNCVHALASSGGHHSVLANKHM